MGAAPPIVEGPLSHIPLFARLTLDEQRALQGVMKTTHAPPNQTIVWCGDRGDTCYIIVSGEAQVSAPNEEGMHIAIDTIGPGSIFGEISLLDGGPRTATVRAGTAMELVALTREDFHRFLRQHPEAAVQVLTIMGERQRAANIALRGMKNPNVAFEASRLSWWQRVSDLIATVAAGKWFTITHLVWFGVWIGINLLAMLGALPPALAFDPFPFGLLTMVVSLEAIFLSIFVMVSQNRQSEKDRLRTDLDYQVNVKAQVQINALAEQLDRIEAAVAGSRREP